VNNRIGLPRHGSRVDNLGHAGEQRPKVVRGHGSTAVQFDIRLDSDTLGGRVNVDGEPTNRARLNESIHSTLDGARRQTHDIANIGIARARILTELLDYSLVGCVHSTTLGDFLRGLPLLR
jgi:hypothetical protein